jgi:hypothetical protein
MRSASSGGKIDAGDEATRRATTATATRCGGDGL